METCEHCGNDRRDTQIRDNDEYICDDCVQFESVQEQLRYYDMNRE